MKNRKKTQFQQAFTLVELIIAMAIIAILSGLTIRTFGTVQNKTRDSRRKQDLQAIVEAFEMYYNDLGHYPYASGGQIMGCGENATQACNWGDIFQNTSNGTLYMAELPQDPGGAQYFYLADSEGTTYRLFAYLENEEDKEAAVDVDGDPGFYQGTYCFITGGAALGNSCNFILKSSNLTTNPEVVSNPLVE
jgi:prepilin-type N-terminal cleavage/methylation domain-containing protein